MRKIKVSVYLSIGYSGASRKDELYIEVDDSATDEQIYSEAGQAAEEWANNFIDISYELIEDEES